MIGDIEKIFLKKLLTNSFYFEVVLSKGIDPSFFSDSTYSWIFEVCLWFFDKYKKLPSENDLKFLVGKSSKIDENRRQLILVGLADLFNTNDNKDLDFTFLLDTFLNHYKETSLRTALFSTTTLLRHKEVDKALNSLKESLIELDSKFKNNLSEDDLTKTSLERIKLYQEPVSELKNVYLGFPTFDSITYGLKPGWVVVVLGANKSGKSTFLLNAALNSYLAGKNVLFLSLEIPKDQFICRWDACRCGIELDKFFRRTLSELELEKVRQALEEDSKRKNVFYIIDTVNFSALSLYGILKRLPYKFDLVVIDYLGLMKTSGRVDRVWEFYSKIGLELREVAREMRIPILTAMQVNREAYKEEKTDAYGVEDVALSFILTCHVDLVLSLKVNDKQALYEGLPVDLTATIVASRVSRNGKFVLLSDFSRMKMVEVNSSQPGINKNGS